MPQSKASTEQKTLKIGLALSGGGAKGLAHIAVIRELEKLGLTFHCLAGTSMGALIAAWYAAGKDLGILEDLARKRQWRRLMPIREMLNAVRQGGGLFNMNASRHFLAEHLGNLKIEKLGIPYCAIATSLKTGSEVKITRGLLSEAVLASVSMPIVFSPVKRGSDLLTDGGLVNNFPLDACFAMGADVVLGVDVRHLPGQLAHEVANEPNQSKQWQIFRVLNYLMDLVHLEKEKNLDQGRLVIFKPYVSHITSFDFDRVDEILQLGKDAFREKEDELRQKLGLVPREKTFWDKLLEV